MWTIKRQTMNKSIILCVLILYINSLFGQHIISPPNPITFDINLKWSEIVENTNSTVDNTLFTEDKYNLTYNSSLLHENKLIELYTNGILNGTYLLCRDLNSGEVLWENSINIEDSEKFEIFNSLYIDGNDIVILGWRQISENPNSIFPVGTSVKRSYDLESGNLLSHVFADLENAVFANNTKAKYFCGHNMTLTTFVEVDNNLGAFFTMNENMQTLDTTVVEFLHPENANNYSSDAIQLSSGNIIISSISYNDLDEENSLRIELIVFNNNLERTNVIDITEFLNIGTVSIKIDESENRLIISGLNIDDDNRQNSIAILTKDGNLINSIKDERSFLGFTIGAYCSESNKYTFVSSSGQDNCFRVTNYDSFSDSFEESSLCHNSNQTNIAPTSMYLNSENIVMYYQILKDTTITELGGTERDISVPFRGVFQTDLNLSSVNNNLISKSEITIYPNPTSGILNIEGLKNEGFRIYNSLGEVVYYNENLSGKQIDLSFLDSNIYFVRISNNHKLYKLIKI